MPKQHCTICAWRQNCNKRFCIADNGARCPDFSRDVTIKMADDEIKQPTIQKEYADK